MFPMATVRPSTVPVTPLPVTDAKFVTSDMPMFRSPAPRDNGCGERMFAHMFETRGQAQQRGRVNSWLGLDRHELGLALGERAGLVHDDRRHLLEHFERLGIPNQHAAFGAAAGTDHDRHRRRETERAGARDDQDRDGIHQGMRQSRLRPVD